MSKFFFRLLSASALSVLIAAHVFNVENLGALPQAAFAYVCITNVIAGLIIFFSITSQSFKQNMRSGWRDRTVAGKIYAIFSAFAWIATLAYIGWMWSFGLHLIAHVMIMSVRAHKDAE